MSTGLNRGRRAMPAELIDMVVDSLHYDKPSLAASSLVCRSWCPRSRRNLFHTVCVKATRNGFDSFLRFLADNKREPGCSPPVSNFIRDLHLHGPNQHRVEAIVAPHDPETIFTTITSTFLTSLLTSIPGLKGLTLEAIQLDSSPLTRPVEDQDHSESRTPFRLDALTLQTIWTVSPSGDDLPHILCLFASIGTLHVTSPFWPVFPFEPANAAINPPVPHGEMLFPSALEVSCLEFRARVLTPYLLALIRRTASVATVRHVDVACRSSIDIRALGSFLDVVGPRLDHVTIDLVELFARTPPRSAEDLQAFNVAACPCLSSLTLRISILPETNLGSHNTSMFLTATTVMQFAPKTIRTLTFLVTLNGWPRIPERFRAILSDNMDTEFYWLRVNANMYPDLQKICFQLDGMGDFVDYEGAQDEFEVLRDIIKMKFKELDDKGMLSVTRGFQGGSRRDSRGGLCCI